MCFRWQQHHNIRAMCELLFVNDTEKFASESELLLKVPATVRVEIQKSEEMVDKMSRVNFMLK